MGGMGGKDRSRPADTERCGRSFNYLSTYSAVCIINKYLGIPNFFYHLILLLGNNK